MKNLPILLLIGIVGHVQAQQLPTSTTPGTDIAYVEKRDFDQKSGTYYDPTFNRTAGWYVSTNPATLQTSILFVDKNQRAIYEEELAGQYVELTAHNRRILDHMLTQLTSHQLITTRLKTRPFPVAWQGIPVSSSEDLPESVPDQPTTLYPTGITSRVLIANKNILCVWVKTLTPEKTTLMVKDPMGKILKSHTGKAEQFTDSFLLAHLPKGSYSVSLYGKTWRKEYEVRIDHNQDQPQLEDLSK